MRDDFAGNATENKTGTEVTKLTKGLAGFSDNRTYDKYLVKPDQRTGELLFGLDGPVIFNGTARRGFIIFKMPSGRNHSWTLQSDFFAGLAEPMGGGSVPGRRPAGAKKPSIAERRQLQRKIEQGSGPGDPRTSGASDSGVPKSFKTGEHR